MTNKEGKSERIAVNLSIEAGEKLRAVKFKVAEELGFTPSLSQVIEHLILKYEENLNKEN
jgi:hypothetical protein